MNRSEVAALLALAAAYDQRTIGQSDVLAWHELLGDVCADDAMAVVKNHYATQRLRLLPVDVIEGVRKVRGKRLDDNPMPEPPPGLSVPDYLEWQRTTRASIADGRMTTEPRLAIDTHVEARVLKEIGGGSFRTIDPETA